MDGFQRKNLIVNHPKQQVFPQEIDSAIISSKIDVQPARLAGLSSFRQEKESRFV